MSKPETAEHQAAAHEQHYRTFQTLLPAECPDRDDLATVGAWRAVLGYHPTLIGRSMGRSRQWVRLRLRWLDHILAPYVNDA